MKIRVTVTGTITVFDLHHYDASTLEEAANNQAEWLRDGSAGIDDILGCSDDLAFSVDPVYDADAT